MFSLPLPLSLSLSVDSGRPVVIMRARIYLIAEREARLVGEYYSPNVCTASIADIASSPSGHKICRTSLATLVMLRTPNSALATLSLFPPPLSSTSTRRCVCVCLRCACVCICMARALRGNESYSHALVRIVR